MQLTDAQRAAFYRDGYIEVAGAIASAPLERALTAINRVALSARRANAIAVEVAAPSCGWNVGARQWCA
jgi:hypothetical protein